MQRYGFMNVTPRILTTLRWRSEFLGMLMTQSRMDGPSWNRSTCTTEQLGSPTAQAGGANVIGKYVGFRRRDITAAISPTLR